jgi:O-succinylbenzoic acid--CoA ligase
MRELWLDGTARSVRALDGALADSLGGGEAVLPLDAANPRSPALAEAMRPEVPVEPGTAVIVATSGSTGEPKGVLLSAEALRTSAAATHERLGGPGAWLLATPAQFIGGLQVLLRARLARARAAVLDLSAGFSPEEFAAAARPVLDTGRAYTALVPTQLARLVEAGGAALAAAREFDAIVLGGAAYPNSLRAEAERAGVNAVPAYGMSETGSGCVYDGVPLDPVRVRLAERDAGVGRVQLAGPVLAHGYRLAPERTSAAFADGWFATGDLGRFAPDGRLEILGRADEVVNTGGVKVAPALVERVLTAEDGVSAACVLGVPDPTWGQRLVAAVVGDPAAEAALASQVRAELGPAATPKQFAFVDELPLRGPGKPDRAALRRLFE